MNLRDTKSGRSRFAFLTTEAKEMLANLYLNHKPHELVFTDRKGNRIKEISNVFARTVNELGLNDRRTDRGQKVVFQTLRHIYASWHADDGTDLYTISVLLGHSNISMTQRYSDLSDSPLQRASQKYQNRIAERGMKKDNIQ